MIRIIKPTVAMSIQDQGRRGYRHLGVCRSGAMDLPSLEAANALAGASASAAGLELGPGPCELELMQDCTIAFAGAERDGAAWWTATQMEAGQKVRLSPAKNGVWSYIAVSGGFQAEKVKGSRSTCVREGIGAWVRAGDELAAAEEVSDRQALPVPVMSGPVRVFGSLQGTWVVSTRMDRMGYLLEGQHVAGAPADEWSEPIPVGTIQLTPSGQPFVMMAEGSTAGGYPVIGYVHPDDLRLLAQTPPGERVRLVPA